MSISVTELVNTDRLCLDPQDIFESSGGDGGMADMRTKYYSAILNSLGSSNTKPVALKKLLALLKQEESCETDLILKLFNILNKIYGKSGEPMQNRVLAGSCMVHVIGFSVGRSEAQKEISSNTSSLINVINTLDSPHSWVPLLTQLMTLFPGPCGPLRGQIWKKLSAEIGSGRIGRPELGRLFSLSPQLGGGGKEGAEHSRAFGTSLLSVMSTLNKIINELFSGVQIFERLPVSEEDVIGLSQRGVASLSHQSTKLDQILDLIEIECSLMASSFPQVREINCEMVLEQISRLLSVTVEDVLKNEIPRNRILAMMLPSLQVQALQILQALIVSVEEDLIPEVATINNILIKSFQMAKSSKVIACLYKVMSVYVKTLGACSGLQLCLDRFIPVLASHVTPSQDKILLLDKNNRKSGGKKKKGRMNIEDVSISGNQASLNLKVARPALSCLGTILESIGCLLGAEDYLSVSSMLVNLALTNQIQDHCALSSLINSIRCLSTIQNPGFSSPIRLSLHFLQHSTLHQNQKVSFVAKQALKNLEPVLYPGCPTLMVSAVEEQEMRQILAKILRSGKAKSEIEEHDSEDETAEYGSESPKENSTNSENAVQTLESVKVQNNLKKNAPLSKDLFISDKSAVSTEKVKEPLGLFRSKPSQVKTNTNSTQEILKPSPISKPSGKDSSAASSKQMKRKMDDFEETIDEDAACIQDNIKQIEEIKRKRKDSEKAVANDASIPEHKSSSSPAKHVEKSKVASDSKKDKQDKRLEPEPEKEKEEELDVASMLKDFSDKLNENLLPDPWDSD